MYTATDVITIIGKRGSGKTTLSRKFHESGIWPRVVVFDRLGEYDANGFSIVVSGFDAFTAAIKLHARNASWRILYRFDIESGSQDFQFNEALRVLYYLGAVCIVVEETWNFSSKNFLPKWYKEILLTGRHGKNKILAQGITLITTSQRPAEVHKTVFSQSNHIFCGTMFENNDIKYLAEFVGRENSDNLQALAMGKFLHFSPGAPIEIVDNGFSQ